MLSGLELMFMGVTQFNSGLLSIPGFIVSPPVGKEKGGWGEGRKKKKGRREKGNRKGKDGRRRNKERSEAR